MAAHEIELDRRTLHGHFSRDLPPILEIEPGDTIRFRTLDAGWGLEPPREDGGDRAHFEPRDRELDSGHALCGPVLVRGARPGDVLAVRVDVVEPGAWGFTWAGLDEDEHVLRWALDAGTATDQHGHAVPLRPFLGVMGMPPDGPGVHSTTPPRASGGNIDCKELVAGSTLFLPVPVAGALFSAGDGHAAQGDGEVSGTAIECPLDRVELTLDLGDDLRLEAPLAQTRDAWISFGFDEDLDAATAAALDGILDLMQQRLDVPRVRALALASIVVDLRITQTVNGVRGVHAVLPRTVLESR